MSCKYFWQPSFLSWDISFFPLFLSYFSRFFECNYGNSRTPFDKMFGTFRDKLAEEGTSYRGGSEEKVPGKKDVLRGKQFERKLSSTTFQWKFASIFTIFPSGWQKIRLSSRLKSLSSESSWSWLCRLHGGEHLRLDRTLVRGDQAAWDGGAQLSLHGLPCQRWSSCSGTGGQWSKNKPGAILIRIRTLVGDDLMS